MKNHPVAIDLSLLSVTGCHSNNLSISTSVFVVCNCDTLVEVEVRMSVDAGVVRIDDDDGLIEVLVFDVVTGFGSDNVDVNDFSVVLTCSKVELLLIAPDVVLLLDLAVVLEIPVVVLVVAVVVGRCFFSSMKFFV